jgi:hypothetical protein
MNTPPGALQYSNGPRLSAQQVIADHRARVLLEENERTHRRQMQLADQRLSSNPPDRRIRAWEKAHGLRLPADSQHPILSVIALDTGLTLQEIQEEQLARRRGAVSAAV